MNKKELIERIEALPDSSGFIRPHIDKKLVLGLVRQLDEPQKPVIPQFVTEHIEHSKKIGRDLQDSMNSSSIHEEVDEWLYTDNNMELFASAWIDGYEVEKEKRYMVKMKNIDTNSTYLKHQLQNNHWYWGSLTECGAFSPYHTKKELEEADFGWVFDCPGIEIEEVE